MKRRIQLLLLMSTLFLCGCDSSPEVVDEFVIEDCVVRRVQLGFMVGSVFIAHCEGDSDTTSWRRTVGKSQVSEYYINKHEEKSE